MQMSESCMFKIPVHPWVYLECCRTENPLIHSVFNKTVILIFFFSNKPSNKSKKFILPRFIFIFAVYISVFTISITIIPIEINA